MLDSVKLKQERAKKVEAQKALRAKATEEKREKLNEEETKQFRELQAEIDDYDGQIADAEAYEENLRKQARDGKGEPVYKRGGNGDDGQDPEAREKSKIFSEFRMSRAIGFVAEGRALDGAEKEVNEIAVQEARELELKVPNKGFNIPSSMLRANSQTVTQDGGLYGGKLVKEDTGEILTPFIPRLTVEELGVKVLMGLTGDYPLYSSGDFTFENLAETATATAQKVQYDKRIMKPKRSACVALISNQLLIQSSIDVENDIRAKIGQALNRRVFIDLINGSGTGANPLGILNDDIFESALPQGIISRAKGTELEGEVDSAESTTERLAYLMHKRLFNAARNIKIDEGSGLFLVDQFGKFNNADTFRTSMIPILEGENEGEFCYPLIFGDWDAVRVGFWGGMNIQADPYTNMASNELRLIINVHKDSLASNPKAFAVNKTITLV